MTSPAAIAELFTQVRGYTLAFLSRASAKALFWTPPHLQNHILWRSGHALWVIDFLVIEPLTGHSDLPTGWAEMFAEGSRPREVISWPAREEVQAQLEQQREHLLGLLTKLPPEQLAGPARGLSPSRTLAGWMIHAIHDEAVHQGESLLILKMVAAAAEK